MVLPGHDSAILDQDQSARDDLAGDDEVSVSAATSITPGGARLVNGDGSSIREYQAGRDAAPGRRAGPEPRRLHLHRRRARVATPPAVMKGGLTVNGAANLLAVNQNLPFNHVEQGGPSPARRGTRPARHSPATPSPLTTSSSSPRPRSPGSRGPGQAARCWSGPACTSFMPTASAGSIAEGWPKFTGGWMQATPAVGDADGDGDLDITTLTREGWSSSGTRTPTYSDGTMRRGRLRRVQRGVVDLPPRRALDQQLRPRRPSAGDAVGGDCPEFPRGAHGGPGRRRRSALVDRPRRRLALRHSCSNGTCSGPGDRLNPIDGPGPTERWSPSSPPRRTTGRSRRDPEPHR